MIRGTKVGLRSAPAIIGYTNSNKPIFSIAGGAGDDEGGDGDDEDGDEEDEEDEESSESGDESSEDEEDDEDDKPVTREQLEKLERRMRAADRRADKAEAALRKERKSKQSKTKGDKDDPEKVQISQERDSLREENTALSVQLAVLTTPDATKFHDPEDVLRFLSFDDLTDEDGNIDRDAVGDALTELAEKKPHLVRTSTDKQDKDKDGDDDKPPPSGRQAGRGKQGGNKQLTREALAKKYPALRQR